MSQLVVCVELEWIHHTTPQPTTAHTQQHSLPHLTSQPRLLLTTRPLAALPTEQLTDQLRDTVEQAPTQSGYVETPPLPG